MLGRTLIEAPSWRLAASLAGRLLELATKRELPGDGQDAVLALSQWRNSAVRPSREGTVDVRGRENGDEPQNGPTPRCDGFSRDETLRAPCRRRLLALRTGERVVA